MPVITMLHFIQSVNNKSCKHTLNTQTEDIFRLPTLNSMKSNMYQFNIFNQKDVKAIKKHMLPKHMSFLEVLR